MLKIQNDNDFKNALEMLSLREQRVIGAKFLAQVMALNPDPRVQRACDVAADPETWEQELDSAFRDAEEAVAESYGGCGPDSDWIRQASHFVAAASAACVVPEGRNPSAGNIAWRVAMHCRMARTCEDIASGAGKQSTKSHDQYAILEGQG